MSLTTVNASADDAISAERPTVAAATWTRPPVATPNAETRPARLPWSMLCVTMYVTAGPGTTASATAASRKTATVDGVGITAPPGTAAGTAPENRGGARTGRGAGWPNRH